MKIYYVDSFTDKAFGGNPAAVVLLDKTLSDSLMLKIAQEIGFSETAFLKELDNGDLSLRWFSPTTEVTLCGHATLATAKVYFSLINPEAISLSFLTKYGKLSCKKLALGDYISIDFQPDSLDLINNYSEIKSFFNFPIENDVFFSRKNNYLVVLTANEFNLSKARIDIEKIFTLNSYLPNIRGLIISNYQDKKVKMRFFDPWEGIPEDPVTGSAALVVAEYWFDKLKQNDFILEQVSLRGGKMRLVKKNNIVSVEGQATIILEGNLMVGTNGE